MVIVNEIDGGVRAAIDGIDEAILIVPSISPIAVLLQVPVFVVS